MSNQFKHEIKITNRFKKRFKNLDAGYQKRINDKLFELGNGSVRGKNLRGQYRRMYSLRVDKYRIFYETPKHCTIKLITVELREVAY